MCLDTLRVEGNLKTVSCDRLQLTDFELGIIMGQNISLKLQRYLGEERFGRFGYLVGSELGSWAGGRIGLMVYDIVNGVHFLLTGQTEENVGKKVDFSQFDQTEETVGDRSEYGASLLKSVMGYVGSYISETSKDVNSEVVGEQNDIGGSFLESVMGYVGSYISEASKDVNSEVVD
ncbi:hypothetical protein Tco_1329508 [Tanacetum coccineum]